MKKKDSDLAMNCLVYTILGVVLMPIVGTWLLCSEEKEVKIIGGILLVVGIILWIYFFGGH